MTETVWLGAPTLERIKIIWLLLRVVRDLVVSCGVSAPEAELLINNRVRNGHFTGFRFEGSFIAPGSWGTAEPRLGFFVPVNFDDSTVKYVRTEPILDGLPPDIAREAAWHGEGALRALKDFLPPPYLGMHLVRLAQHEVLAMLDKAGLSKPPEASTPAPAPMSMPPTLTPSTSPTPTPPEPTPLELAPAAPRHWTVEILEKHPELQKDRMKAEAWVPLAATVMPRRDGQLVKDYRERLMDLSKAAEQGPDGDGFSLRTIEAVPLPRKRT
jgi:hypothetical protein